MSDEPRPARRALVGGVLAAAFAASSTQAAPPAGPSQDAAASGVRPNASEDQTPALQRALAAAARAGQALRLAPGRYRASGLSLPPGARLIGGGATTILVQAGSGPLLTARGAEAVTLQHLTLEGSPVANPAAPLVLCSDVKRVDLSDLSVANARGTAIRLERCGGRVERTLIRDVDIAISSLDAVGLSILANTVEGCANNGIQVWRSRKGDDGTLIAANRVSRVTARAGGSGQNGNGISLFRAGGGIVSDNVIRDCAFSAVRDNSGDNVQILGNSCHNLGEVALYVEFGFNGGVVANNVVDGASVGVSITNFNEGGRLATATGNVLRNLFRRPDPDTGALGQGVGIAVEADAAVTGNVIEGAAFAGLSVGYGPYLRDVLVSGNVVRQSGVGVAVSVAPNAGAAQIANNLFSRCPGGGIVGHEWDKAASADLTFGGAGRFAHLAITGNTVR
jgi:uncharacterized secreted repeat protein (TIGR03808 family)